MFSKPSRMRIFIVDSHSSMGRKTRVGRRSWGVLLFLLFSFPFSVPPSSQNRRECICSHIRLLALLFPQCNSYSSCVPSLGPSLARDLEIQNCNWHKPEMSHREMGIRSQHSLWRQQNAWWIPSFPEQTPALWATTASGTHHLGGRRPARMQGWEEPSKGNPDGICGRKLSLWGCWDTTSPTGCGNFIVREIQISGGQIPKQPDLPQELPLPWAGVLDQINSSPNPKYSVILWIPASLNKNRPKDCTASILMESHRGISESYGISSFIWGTSWDIIWKAKSKLWYVLTTLL